MHAGRPVSRSSSVRRVQSINLDTNIIIELPVRETLPYLRDPKQKFSLWTIIKDSIGKDLTKVSLPVYMNEPLTMLQTVAQMVEYHNLLDEAVKEPDPLVRIALVGSFCAAQYSNLVGRTLKPFNPILGETYEYATNDVRFFSEQVSHHPPISACHMQGSGYEMWTHTHVKNSFKGKSILFSPLGSTHVVLRRFGEHFTMNRPYTTANNLIIGTVYLDLHGKTIVTNHKTGEICEMDYKRRGWGSKNAYCIDGVIKDATGVVRWTLKGKWNESISITNIETGQERLIWKVNPRPDNWDHLYHFSLFSMQLNNTSPELEELLPATDSRLRPDLRALENGEVKLAATEKHRLEEKQRKQRKEREKKGEEFVPAYFIEIEDELTGETSYQFTKKYWHDREKQEWSCPRDIF